MQRALTAGNCRLLGGGGILMEAAMGGRLMGARLGSLLRRFGLRRVRYLFYTLSLCLKQFY